MIGVFEPCPLNDSRQVMSASDLDEWVYESRKLYLMLT